MSKIKSLIPNLLTAGNLAGGILAILFSLTGRLEWAPYCIFVSAFLDFFDGFVARLLNVQSELGKQLDSLADMVTFGVAPGIIVFQLIKFAFDLHLSGEQHLTYSVNGIPFSDPDYLYIYYRDFLPSSWPTESWSVYALRFLAFLLPVFAMFRLAKFNLDTRQSDSFIGVPTPAMTLFFASIPLILANAGPENGAFMTTLTEILINPWFLLVSVLLFSYLMVAELPLFALKFKSFGWKGNGIRYSFLTLAVVLLATLHWLAIPILIILYVLLSIIQNLVKK